LWSALSLSSGICDKSLPDSLFSNGMQTLGQERGCGSFGMGLWLVFQIRLIIISNCTNKKEEAG
jgi:hypothetical protein